MFRMSLTFVGQMWILFAKYPAKFCKIRVMKGEKLKNARVLPVILTDMF